MKDLCKNIPFKFIQIKYYALLAGNGKNKNEMTTPSKLIILILFFCIALKIGDRDLWFKILLVFYLLGFFVCLVFW